MGCPVEIEFAGNLSNNPDEAPTFYLLQIRPFVEHEENLIWDVETSSEDLLVYSNKVSGNRVIKDIQDIVYIKPESFDSSKTLAMVTEVTQINKYLAQEQAP